MVFLVWSFVWCSNWIAMTFFTANSGSNSPFLIRWMLLPMIRSLLNNMYEMENFLKQTDDINWTVVRPPGLKNIPTTGGIYNIVLGYISYFTNIYIYCISLLEVCFCCKPLDHHTFSVIFLVVFKANEFLTHEGYYVPDENGLPIGPSVSRGDVARFMLSLLSNNAWMKKAVAIITKWVCT